MSNMFGPYTEDFRRAFRPNRAEDSPQAAVDLQSIRAVSDEGVRLQQNLKWAEAAEKLEFCVQAYREALGDDADDTTAVRGQLARSYRAMGQYLEAWALWKKCEDVNKKRFGPSHLNTLDYTGLLLTEFVRQRQWIEAKEKGESFLEILKQTLGPQDPRTLGVVLQLGSVYVNLQEYNKALEYHQHALAGFRKAHGSSGNLETIHAQFRLGALYGEFGDLKKAANIYQENRDICSSTRGITNQFYLRAAVNLGSTQRRSGNDIEAEKTLLSLLPETGPNRQDHDSIDYIEQAADELVKLYNVSGRQADAKKAEAWINGSPASLLEIKHAKLQGAVTAWSPKEGSGEQLSNWDVVIFDDNGDKHTAVALIDTACQTGNWVSLKLVERLDKASSVSQEFESPGIVDAHGTAVRAAGVIELTWRKHPRGNKSHHCRFFVFADIDQFDLLIGIDYIERAGLMSINDAMVPLIAHNKIKKDDKATSDAKENQKAEKEALDKRKQAKASQQAQQQAQGNQSQQ
ncbi:hypothetical protein P171DRAFT_471369 [Karstenula rhodostoma CBS 690.94]|uniref:TPR-like protein n=1 Tax=Karstenula rhodostoma CBS 690.94 TaxID=1392251 RepID=A0A9P4PKU6_9PLEO|nr:hypothetical protein P171DRAFT_471369 [Karstenula rhodostoma CBS 690.94]